MDVTTRPAVVLVWTEKKKKPERALGCPLLCVCCYPIPALIEHCLTPFIRWTDNEGFSVHPNVSIRYLVEKN